MMNSNLDYNNLFENAEFLEKFQKTESKDDLQKLFKEYGLDLSREEIDEFVAEFEKVSTSTSGELDEASLEAVAGGAITIGKLAKWCWGAMKAGWNAGKKFWEWEQSLYK